MALAIANTSIIIVLSHRQTAHGSLECQLLRICHCGSMLCMSVRTVSTQLRQIRSVTVRRSLDVESVATLVHAFVSNRVDYCCSLLAGRRIT